jgi:hypothetical protein
MHKVAAPLVLLALVVSALPASAQKPGRILTIPVVNITGRVKTPLASIDVTKVAPSVSLVDLQQPLAHRVDDAVRRDPF